MSEKLNSDDFFFAEKPSGISTHRPAEDRQGFVEYLSKKTNLYLKVCHRLDKETSGALVFAKKKEAAQKLTHLFENHKVEKEYWFISDQKSSEIEWEVSSEIKKGAQKEHHKSELGSLAHTRFKRVNQDGPFYLYKAYPRTGKTHQIRIHATQSKIPILGDETYGGKNFPRLMLHSYSLKFELDGRELSFQSKVSRLFQNLDLCKDLQLSSWIQSYERREALFPKAIQGNQCLRLLHSETGDLRADKAGEVLVLGWWKSEPPSDEELNKIKKFVSIIGTEKWFFQWRPKNKNDTQLEILLSSDDLPESWNFKENQCEYVGSMNRGHNFGLFLDQRDRRQWVGENCKGKKVLNLFSFTCGFSLSAALGGAEQVVSVDLSKKYLEWGKENFSHNDLDPNRYEFRGMDSFEYLNFAKKKGMSFDIVICDPPSFSRHKGKKKTFKVEKDYFDLIKVCGSVLKENGTLLFSTNFETWDYLKWKTNLQDNLLGMGFDSLSSSESQWDYEWQKREANLKAFFLKKSCSEKA